jgi:uroporphyrin-3 C-methyltransferase
MVDTTNPEISDRRKPSLLSNTALILVVIALLTLAWQWVSTRQRFNEVEKSLSQKLEDYQANNQQSLALAKQAEERSTQANARTILLEQKLEESRDQQDVLQTLYDQLAENREATALAEVEQLLTIANQQLQLVGNVKSALLALQAADKRLEPLNLPRANQLGMSAQLETLANICSTIPLISERQPTLNAKATQKKNAEILHQNTWQKIAYPIWEDIKSLVSVERIDKPEPPLLSVDHEFYLRENLKLRLLTARVALLQHDETSYKADLATVSTWIYQYYDAKHPNAIQAFKLLKQLSGNNIDIELPQLTESIAAVNRYKLSLEKSD